jgi:hypothetical protein
MPTESAAAGCSPTQAKRRPVKDDPDHRHQGKGQVDQYILLKQHRPDQRQVAQDWEVQGLEPGSARRDIGAAEDHSIEKDHQPGGHDHQHDAGDALAGAQGDADEPQEQIDDHAAEHASQHSNPQAAAEIGADEAEEGAHEHDPLHAQVEHARGLGKDLPQRSEQQRCGHTHGGGQQAHEDGAAEKLAQHLLKRHGGSPTWTRSTGCP